MKRLNFLLGISFLIGITACSPGKRLTQGSIDYRIESFYRVETPAGSRIIKIEGGISDTTYTMHDEVRSFTNTYPRNISFDPMHLRESAYEFSDTFEDFIQTHRNTENRLKFLTFAGKSYAISLPTPKNQVEFIPLKGRERILGYTCKRALLRTEDQEIEIYYTPRIESGFSPLGYGMVEGCVLKFVEDPGKVRNPKPFLGAEKIVTQAVQINSTSSSAPLFSLPEPYHLISESGFQQLISGYSFEQLSPGTTAEEIDMPDLSGNPFRLSDFRGQPILLYFWQKNNAASQSMLATFQTFQHRYPSVKLLTLTTDQVADSETFSHKYRLLVPTIPNAAAIFGRYKLREIPSTILISPEGTFVESIMGAGPMYEQQLSDLLDRNLTAK